MDTGGSGAEQYCTIVSLAESPVRAGVLWAGTDDGKVWVSPDAGTTWSDLTRNLKGVPPGLYVSRIEASHRDAKTAYVSIDGHRSDVIAPYLFVTRDMGRTWTPLMGDLPKDVTVNVVREDLSNPDLLWAGTEFGLYVSFDAGHRWLRWSEGLPMVAIDDILIHPRERDVLVATHGRSVYALDGVQLLEQWNARSLVDTVQFAPPRTAWEWYARTLGGKWGQHDFLAKNPPFGAWFDYFLPRELEGGVSIAVTDSAGHAVRTLAGTGEPGFHRVVWDLVGGEPRTRIGRREWDGQPVFVPPGTYTVKLSAGKAKPLERALEVRAVPGSRRSEL
jgi:photosystem II stability/assembly factor-like uncharacterized protein